MPFIVAGYPNFQTSRKIAKQLIKEADLLEIGFPYSDPLADGPVIQAADTQALKSGMTTKKVFRLIKEIRKESEAPITVLVYANLLYQQGIENFYRQASACGITAVLVPDLPIEESDDFILAAKKYNIAPIFLVAQTTTSERLKKISQYAEGYLYLVSVLGVTGARTSFQRETMKLIRFVKKNSSLPVAVGFGISNPSQIKELKKAGADGVIVGSALVRELNKSESACLKLAKELKNAC